MGRCCDHVGCAMRPSVLGEKYSLAGSMGFFVFGVQVCSFVVTEE